MVMTVHKLTAGDGYTYLTRHIAGGDSDRQRGQSAADYYTAKGNPAGQWIGRGAHLLDLDGTRVSEAQMKALFGHGMHPDAERIVAEYQASHIIAGMDGDQLEAVNAAARKAATLGRPFPTYKALEPFEDRVAERLEDIAEATRRAPNDSEIRKVHREETARPRGAVAGYDAVFSPVKSAALLWALDPRPEVRRAVRDAHQEAMDSALRMLEEHAAFTRTGTGGIAQIETKGLIAAAFTHYDSRDGDPNPHTHVAIVNKIMGVDGRWRSLDGRALYRIVVAASEHYNTAFQTSLTAKLDVHWTAHTKPGKSEPVHEIDGVPTAHLEHFSRRRAALTARYTELLREHRRKHGADPSAKVAHRLARQANLDTRQGKKAPRSLAEMRADWARQLPETFGPDALTELMAAVLDLVTDTAVRTSLDAGEPLDVDSLAARVVARVGEQRSTWTRWNLHAETERLLRTVDPLGGVNEHRVLAGQIVARAAGPGVSLSIEPPSLVEEPAPLRRSDGTSVFVEHGAARYTSQTVLDAEQRLLDAARTVTTVGATGHVVAAAIRRFERHTDRRLDDGQRALVTAFATDNRLLVAGLGAAGTGKTTAMRAYLAAAHANGQRVIPLATSAASAAVLAQELDTAAENVHKFVHEHTLGPFADRLAQRQPIPSSWRFYGVGPGDVVLVDEAGMAGTGNLDRIVAIAQRHGAVVRLLGDYRQLGAVESGGVLRLIAADIGAVELSTVHRFTDPAEATATVKLRVGDSTGLDFYQANNRIVGGSKEAMLDAAYAGWKTDVLAGKVSIMSAATNIDVAALSAQARAERVTAGQVETSGVELADGNPAGAGDWIVTRHNDRNLRCTRDSRAGRGGGRGGQHWVRNGDTWTVLHRHPDGTLDVQSLRHGGRVRLPADYVTGNVQLMYATTTHRVQGDTVDTAHALVTDTMARENLYVAATRARLRTMFYVATHVLLPFDEDERMDLKRRDPDAQAAREVLDHVLASEAAERSATETIRDLQDQAASLATLMPRLIYASEQAAAARYETTAGQLLGAELTATLSADKAWPAVVRALHQAEHSGWQAAQLLAAATRRGPLTSAESPARLLAHRIGELAAARAPASHLARPTPADADRYADLVATRTGTRPDPRTALDTPPGLLAAPTRDRQRRYVQVPAAQLRRYADATAAVLSVDPETVPRHRAWPHLAGILAAAECAGHPHTQLLCMAAATGPGDIARLGRTARAIAARHGATRTDIRIPASLRHHQTATDALGPDLADRARGETAWPALHAAITRTHTAGHDTATVLRAVAGARDLDGVDHVSQVLAWRLTRYTNTLPAPTGPDQTAGTWRNLAWTMKAYKTAGGNPAALLSGTTPGDHLDDVYAAVQAAAARHTATSPTTDSSPPWTPRLPRPGMPGNQIWGDYLHGMHDQIAHRAAQLADELTRQRPAWSHALGQSPGSPTERRQWLRHAATTAAYRDQHVVLDDDARRPLGPYIEAGMPGHHAYWHAATAIVHAHQLAETTYSIRPRHTRTVADDHEQAIAHRIAIDTYLGLPESERIAVARTLVGLLGNLWHGHDSDLDSGVTQPVYSLHLTRALTARRHLGHPEPATTDTAPPRTRQPHDDTGAPNSQNGIRQPLRTARHHRGRADHEPAATATAQQPGAGNQQQGAQSPLLKPPPQQHTPSNGPHLRL